MYVCVCVCNLHWHSMHNECVFRRWIIWEYTECCEYVILSNWLSNTFCMCTHRMLRMRRMCSIRLLWIRTRILCIPTHEKFEYYVFAHIECWECAAFEYHVFEHRN